ncbi:MAG: hypothetical protein AB7V55_02835 [Oscillospiraceae bacterium]
MAQVAYELERFAPAAPKAPRVRVAKAPRTARQSQFAKMLRTLLAALVVVLLVSGVLYTQTTLNELQRGIVKANKALLEEESLHAWLTFELENTTSMKNIEERAQELGLEKMNNGQVTYFRAEDGNTLQVRENPLMRIWENARNGLLGIMDSLIP